MSTKKNKDLMKYYSINLPELRALCKQKGIKGINKKSNRQQLINAIIAHDKTNNKNKPLHRRRSLPKHTPQTTPTSTKSTTNSSNTRRSRKRSRKDLNEDFNQISDDTHNKKRRKTNTPSTMTTPERNRNISQSPIRNPRIPSNIQNALHKSGYRSVQFNNLLNDSSDDDMTPDNIKNKATVMKESSPEDSDEESPKNNNIYNKNNNESSSDSDSNNSESQSSNFDDGITPNKRVPHKRLLSYDSDSKSPSRPIVSNPKFNIVPKPSPIKPTGRYNIGPQITQPQPQPPVNQFKPKVQSHGLSYQTMSPSRNRVAHPSVIKSIHEVSNELNLQDDINRIRPNNNGNNNENKSYSMMDSIYNAMYYIKWPFVKLYQVVRFVLIHWIYFAIICAVIALGYSPTMKIINSTDWNYVTVTTLQNVGILSGDKYCDCKKCSDPQDPEKCVEGCDALYTGLNSDCKKCPEHATCVDGNVYCEGDRRFIKGKCIYDKAEMDKLESQMQSYSERLLSERCGQFVCQEYRMYNYIYGIEDKDRINDKGLDEEELANELATVLQLQKSSHLFTNVFNKFIGGIKDTNKTIHLKSIGYNKKTEVYYSRKGYKGIGCNLIVFFSDNCVWIVPLGIFMNVFIIWYIRRYMKLNRILKEKQIASDRKDEVVMLLKNYQNNVNQRWIPIEQIKSQIMRDGNSKEKWVRVEKLVDRDANIQKSAQMVDGLQRLCWKLSDTALID